MNIEKCNICQPDFSCVKSPNGRTHLFPVGEEYYYPEEIIDCPIFREKVEIEPVINSKADI